MSDCHRPATHLFDFPTWPDGVIAVDEHNKVCLMSPTATAILGWSAADAAGKDLHTLLCSNSREAYHEAELCPLLNPEPDPYHSTSAYWVDSHGDNVGVDFRQWRIESEGIEKKFLSFYANRTLLHSQSELNKYAEYVDKSPAPIAEFDGDGQILFGNPAMQQALLKFGFDDLGGALIAPENLADICQRSWQEQIVINHIEVAVGESWFSWHFHPMPPGQNAAVMGFAFDITEQKTVQVQIAKEKADARRDFIAKMVHELRTPLNAIVGFSQVLLRRNMDVMSARDLANLKAIRAAGLQLNEMVSDTLDISKIEAGKMGLEIESFNIAQVFESFHEQMSTLAEVKSLTYQCEYDAQLAMVSDFKKVRQTLINLISNAIKYTRQGSVSVNARHGQHPKLGACLVFCVEDTGVGIAREQFDTLFRAYEQVSEGDNKSIQGTGLGLALVSELVAILGGAITLESEQGKGSCFTVFLPSSLVKKDS